MAEPNPPRGPNASFAPGPALHAPATARNRDPILAVLRRVLPERGTVLEIASGTGEHAAWFAASLPSLTWQPSDPDEASRGSIAAHRHEAVVPNLQAPIRLDVTRRPWPVAHADAVVCINMIHIAPWDCGAALLAEAGTLLPAGGALYLYGPFRREGRHTAASNIDFDHWLKGQDPRWGVRDLDAVAAEADGHGLLLEETVEMPANNLSAVFRKS